MRANPPFVLFRQFRKFPKSGHISVLIVWFHVLENVKDFARYNAADKAARFLVVVAFAD